MTGLTNAAIALAIQVTGGSEWLGAWAIASAPLTVAIALQRALLSQSALRGARLRLIRGCGPTLVGVAAAAVAATILLAVWFSLPAALFLVALSVPPVLFQDAYRLRQFGLHRPEMSMYSDTIWLGLSLATATTLGVVENVLSPAVMIIAYAVGACAAAGFSAATWPKQGKSLQKYPRTAYLMLESGSIIGLSNIAQIVVAGVVSLGVVGELKLAQTLIQPVIFVGNFSQSLLVPKLDLRSNRSMRRMAGAAGALCLGSGLVCLIVIGVLGPILDRWMALDSDVLIASAVLIVGLSIGVAIAIEMVRVRAAFPPRAWLPARIAGAIADPLVSIPAGIVLGAPGLALGPLANNLVLLLARTAIRTASVSREAAEVPSDARE